MKNKKILFAGYYGQKNMGDDMFGLVSVWGAKHYWENNNTKLLSGQGAVSKNIDIQYALSKKRYFKGQLLLENYFEIIKSSYVILSGGSILHSRTSFLSSRGFAYYLAKIKFIKIGAIGVSVGPFKSDDDYNYIESVLKNFKFLTLRDKTSYNLVSKMELPYKPVLVADLAFMLPEITKLTFKKNTEKTYKTVGVSLCHYERYAGLDLNNEKRREKAIYTVLSQLAINENIRFRFFVINGNTYTGDLELTQSMIDRLSFGANQYEIVSYTPYTLEMYELIGSCDVMYSTRLHGAIFASAANIPSLLVEYHQKCTDYLDDIGVDKEWRIGDMDTAPAEVSKKIENLLKNKQNKFYANREEMLESSQKNFTDETILKEMIS